MLFCASEAESVGEILSGAGLTILIGLVVVFAALIALTFIFWLFGKVVGSKQGQPKQEEAPVPAKTAPAARTVLAPPQVQTGISEEVVAAIAAAVMSMAPEGKQYVIRSISRGKGERPVWAAAGLMESTRPF